jgi:hypothetical protein
MSASTHKERGRTAGETIFALLVIAAIGFGVYLFVRPPVKSATPTSSPSPKHKYKCMTTPDGLVPLKAVIVPRQGAAVYTSPRADAATEQRLPMFESYFPVAGEAGFLRVGNDPMSEQSIGWLRKSDVLLWPTREALSPNRANPDRKMLTLWLRRDEVGDAQRVAYDEDPDADQSKPYPVLDVSKGSFKIALTWQTSDFSDVGVDTAWTQPLEVPDDARFFYLTTRNELKKDIEEMNAAFADLDAGTHAEHPIIRFLKKNVDMTIGEKVDSGDDTNVLRQILSVLRNPLKIAREQPAEIRRDSANLRRKLGKLREFSQNGANWNSRGTGWLPAEYLPGN